MVSPIPGARLPAVKFPITVAALVLSACAGAGPQPAVRQPPVAIAPTAHLLARPGEQMTYAVSIHNLAVAELVISVGGPTTFEGKDVLVVQHHTTSSTLLGWARPLDDTLTSWIDRTTGRPVAYKAVELASRDDTDIQDSESRFTGSTFPVRVVRRGETADEQQTVRDAPYDVPSMLTFLRGWTAEPGAQVSVDVMRSRSAYRSTIAVAAFENLPTALGDLPVVRYDGEVVRLRRDGSEDPESRRRRFSIWITDDADRVPARMVADTDYGDIEVALAAYRAQ